MFIGRYTQNPREVLKFTRDSISKLPVEVGVVAYH